MYSMCVFSIVFRKFQVGGETPLAQLILIQQLWGHSIKRMTTVEANSSSNRNLDSRTWGRLLWGRSSSSVESSSCWAWWGLTTKIRSESGRRVGAAAATEMDSRLFMIELRCKAADFIHQLEIHSGNNNTAASLHPTPPEHLITIEIPTS